MSLSHISVFDKTRAFDKKNLRWEMESCTLDIKRESFATSEVVKLFTQVSLLRTIGKLILKTSSYSIYELLLWNVVQ